MPCFFLNRDLPRSGDSTGRLLRRLRCRLCLLFLALATVPAARAGADELVRPEEMAREAAGRLLRYDSQRVLVVRGTPHAMGLAHGRLLREPFLLHDLRALVAGEPAPAPAFGTDRSVSKVAETGRVRGAERAIEGVFAHPPADFDDRLAPLRRLGEVSIAHLTYPSPGPSRWKALGEPEIHWYDGGHYALKGHVLEALDRITGHFARR